MILVSGKIYDIQKFDTQILLGTMFYMQRKKKWNETMHKQASCAKGNVKPTLISRIHCSGYVTFHYCTLDICIIKSVVKA